MAGSRAPWSARTRNNFGKNIADSEKARRKCVEIALRGEHSDRVHYETPVGALTTLSETADFTSLTPGPTP